MRFYGLIILVLFSFIFTFNVQSQPAKNQYRDNAKDISQSIEKKISQYLLLKKQGFEYQAPVLAKDYAVPIRNPFTQLPETTYQAFAQKGIDLKAMSKYKALYMAGSLAGNHSIKVVNTESTTVLVIGAKTITHDVIFSRGPVVVIGESNIMNGIYAKDLLWLGASAIGSALVGLPYASSSIPPASYNLGIGLYSLKEELQAIEALGEKKTYFSTSNMEEVKSILLNKSEEPASKIVLQIKMPSLKNVDDIEQKSSSCNNYANRAVEQHKINIKLRCGFKGLRWNSDKEGQKKWCLTVLDILTEREANARQEKLTSCFIQKTSSDNAQNRLKLPKGCYDEKNKYTPVKSIFSAYRYRKSISQVVENGVIQYDYNKDGKKDYVFIEQSKKNARIGICMSDQSSYLRLKTNMEFFLNEGVINSQEYSIRQKEDKLIISIALFSHNEGSSFRQTSFRYNTSNQGFDMIDNEGEASGVSYGEGEEYPMSLPIVPEIKKQ